MDSPATPTPAPATPTPRAPDPSPLPLWTVLEDEFRDLHGAALELDAAYLQIRDENLESAWQFVAEEISLRAEKRGETLTPGELQTEVEGEIRQKPELINGPGCQELFQRIHRLVEAQPEHPFLHSALCLSGGGIRSATFGLGILQGLAEKNKLQRFAYLSTVSGGGYIGSWLSAWIRQKGADRVYQELGAQERSAADTGIPKDPLNTEPAAIRYLRQYSNYLTPNLGLLSGDGLAVAATVARNLFLNWLLILPVFLCALLLPRAALGLELHGIGREKLAGEIAAGVAFVCGVMALTNLVMRRNKTQKDVLLYCMLPLILFSAFATLAWFWARSADPENGFFTVDWHRPVFYMAWGGLTAAIASLIRVFREKEKQPNTPF